MDSYDEIGEKLDNYNKQTMAKIANSFDEEAKEQSRLDKELPLFIDEWLKNGLNATQAYKMLHPDVTEGSARTLGSRWLRKVDKTELLSAYNLGINDYFTCLKEALSATKRNQFTGEVETDYKVRLEGLKILGKLLGLSD